jgi:glycine cleavage system H lipoate-binding protein
VVALGIVALILLALTLDFFVEKLGSRRPVPRALQLPDWLSRVVPLGILVDPAHVWLHREKDQLVRLGGDGFAVAALGKPDKVTVLARTGAVARGDALVELSRGDRSVTLRSPVRGTLVESNAALAAKDVIEDPFGRGWFAIVRSRGELTEDGRQRADHVPAWLASEWRRLREFVLERARLAVPAAATMADGGSLQPGFLPQLSGPDCLLLEQTFFAVEPLETSPEASAREEA